MGECVDITCQTVTEHCKTCGYDPMTKTTECLDCTTNRILVGTECVCKVGFYELNDVCKSCPSGCQSCEMSNN